MITLEQTLLQQKDLTTLCSDRPLKTRETFTPNAYYGNDFILKQYASLPNKHSLRVIIPHGIDISDNFLWEAERDSTLPAFLCYSSLRKPLYNSTNKKIIHSAHTFVYLTEILKEQPSKNKKGTIFFPIHSTHHVTVQTDFEAMAKELISLDKEYQPITVCIYWRDYNLGHHLPFLKRKLCVVSAGHIYDPLFLYRFYYLCSMHHYSASNSIGSSLFFSIKAGCSYFPLDNIKYSHTATSQILKRDTSHPSLERKTTIKTLFKNPQPFTTTRQMETIDYYLGTQYLLTPLELRHQLLHVKGPLNKYYNKIYPQQVIINKLKSLKSKL